MDCQRRYNAHGGKDSIGHGWAGREGF